MLCIGGDCPGLMRTHLAAAAGALTAGTDLVLGPTLDGGYYLIGLARPQPELFEDIPWSHADTLKATLRQAERRHLKWQLLDALYDVDEATDLERALKDGLLPA